MIVIVFGLPGSGKTYFASQLALQTGGVHINSDRVRKKLISHKTYSSEEKLTVYNLMLDEMKEALKQKKNVILDATFYKDKIRKKFIDSVKNKDIIRFIEVKAEENIIKERLQRKREDSDADFKVYKIIESHWEPLKEPHLVLYSTNENIDELLVNAIKFLDQNDTRSN